MHLVKTFASGALVLLSLLWLAIQQLLLPNEFVRRLFVSPRVGNVDFLQLKRDWCRVRSKRVAWREMLEPCQEKALFMTDTRYTTNPTLSHVSQIIANPAGEHTRLRIDTYTGHGVLKSFGGDSIRVSFRGPDVVSAAVFDLQNGSYDALALLVTPGEYGVEIILDYSQCNGFKDPPSEWYIKAHCSRNKYNATIPPYVSANTFDYINKYISPGLKINITPPRYNIRELQAITANTDCGFACKLIWDGHGVWSKDGKTWQPYVDSLGSSSFKTRRKEKSNNKGLLWIYGDSISYYFYHRLRIRRICRKIFNHCKNTYNWIYPKRFYESRHFCEDVDVSVSKLRQYFREMVNNEEMNENSVLIFNLGAHFVKNTSFRKYRAILDALIEELQTYRGKAIWKSTTAIHHQNIEVMGAFRRFLTNQRVLLFNAYANAAICNAEIQLLDVNPLSASYPAGTKDGVHYHANVSLPMELMLEEFFS